MQMEVIRDLKSPQILKYQWVLCQQAFKILPYADWYL